MTHKAHKVVSRKRQIYRKYKDTTHPAVIEASKAARREVNKAKKYRPTEFRFLFIFRRQKTHFLFFGVLFYGRKSHPHFRFLLFFGTKMAVKKQKRKSVLWLSQCTAGRTLESPAVAYSRCLHRHTQRQ